MAVSGKVRRDMTKSLVRVERVEPRKGFIVDVQFTDGSKREINLAPYLKGPIFEPIRNDPSLFHALQVEEGAIAWPNGADIDPDVLYYGLMPAWAIDGDTAGHSDQLL